MWWRVGDGRNVEIWCDRWITGVEGGILKSQRDSNTYIHWVSELLEEKRWNKRLLSKLFSTHEAEKIASIALSIYQRKDRWVWNFSKIWGIYYQIRISPSKVIKPQC